MQPLAKSRDIPKELLQALSGGQSLDRGEIATAIGKTRLNPMEIKHLEELVESGQVSRNEVPSGIVTKFVYRKQ